VQIASTTAPGTYHYICLVHPGMSGTITVVPAGQPASTPAALAAQATAEYNQLTTGALAAEAAAEVPTSTPNANGSRTWTVHVGVTVDDVELLEFLPANLPITKGDSVKYDGSGTTQEPHTVTTLAGFQSGLGAFGPNQCEAASGADTLANQTNGPPQAGCADPNGIEQPFNLRNQGELNAISSAATAASAFVSGRADTQTLGGATSHTYQFPANGKFILACSIHQGMYGVVNTAGYRVASRAGSVFTFGAADFAGSQPAPPSPVVASPASLDNQGYWLVTANGHTYNFGDAASVGNISGPYNGSPIVAAQASAGGGLWLVARDGRVYPLGRARSFGDLGGVKLAAPIVGISSTIFGQGYDLVASDGGVFTFGTDAFGNTRFFGSLGHVHLNAPIVGIADNIDAEGYYLVASDGGIFTFGSAVYAGSLGAVHLNSPIVGMAATDDPYHPGYRLVAGDGGVFDFGIATFLGSAAPQHPPGGAVAINAS
jgi:plastocyanin